MEEDFYGTFDPDNEFVLSKDDIATILEHIQIGTDEDLNNLINAMNKFIGDWCKLFYPMQVLRNQQKY